jgi:hypothetical protein
MTIARPAGGHTPKDESASLPPLEAVELILNVGYRSIDCFLLSMDGRRHPP